MLRQEPIRRIMNPHPLIVGPEADIAATVDAMRKAKSSCVLVCEAGHLLGIFTERDHLLRIAGRRATLTDSIVDHMTREPQTLSPDQSLGEAIDLICEGNYRHLPVVEGGSCCGLVTAMGVVRSIADLFPTEVYNLPPQLDQVMRQVEGA